MNSGAAIEESVGLMGSNDMLHSMQSTIGGV